MPAATDAPEPPLEPPWTARKVPGIVDGTKEHGFRRWVVAEFRGLRGAEEHQTGAAEARHQFGVFSRNESLRKLRAHIATNILGVEHKLLDEKRHARERTLR